MTEMIKADVRTLRTHGKCLICGSTNNYALNNFKSMGIKIPSFCPRCRKITEHKTTFTWFDVRGFVVSERGYDLSEILVDVKGDKR
jgi:hypothetical protein